MRLFLTLYILWLFSEKKLIAKKIEGNTILVKRNICRCKTVLRKKFGVVVIFIPFQGSVDRFRKVDRSNLWSLQGKSVSYPDPATIPESLLHIPVRRERETY